MLALAFSMGTALDHHLPAGALLEVTAMLDGDLTASSCRTIHHLSTGEPLGTVDVYTRLLSCDGAVSLRSSLYVNGDAYRGNILLTEAPLPCLAEGLLSWPVFMA